MIRNLSVRVANKTDGKYVTLQVRKFYQLLNGLDEPPEVVGLNKTWNQIIEDPKYRIFIAEDDRNGNKPCGVAVTTKSHSLHLGGEILLLQDLIVDTEFRSGGIGSSLLSAVEDYAQKNNIVSIELTQPPPNSEYDEIRNKFYEKHGYSLTGMGRCKPVCQPTN